MFNDIQRFFPVFLVGSIVLSILICALILIAKIKNLLSYIISPLNRLFMVADMAASETNNTPRQLQNLTNTYTEIIKRDFPEFDTAEFLTSAENTLVAILNSLEAGSIPKCDNLSSNLSSKIKGTIEDIKSKKEQWFFDDIFVHKSSIAKYSTTAGQKIITIEVAIQYSHRVMRNGQVFFGDRQVKQYKYSMDAVYVQDITKMGNNLYVGNNCPNCGAPFTQTTKDRYCHYCGTGLTEVNKRIWLFDNYKRC